MASINYYGIRDDLKSILGLLQKLDDTMVRYLDSRQNSMPSCSQQFVESDVDVCLEDVHNAEEMAQSEADSDFANGNSNLMAMSEVCSKIGTSLNSVPFDSILVSIASFENVDTSLDTLIDDDKNLQNNATQVFDKTPKWQKSCFLSAMSCFLPNKSNNLPCSGLIVAAISANTRFTVVGSPKEIDLSIVDLNNRGRGVINSNVNALHMLLHFPFDPGLYMLTNLSTKVLTKKVCFNMSLDFRKLQKGVNLRWNFDGLINAEASLNLVSCHHDLASHKLFEINSPQFSFLVERLLIAQYVHGVKIGIEGNGLVGSSCPIYKLLEMSIDTSLLYSFDCASNYIEEQYSIECLSYLWSGEALELVLIEHYKHLFVTQNLCWAKRLVEALEFINYSCAGNHESEDSYGILALYHIVGGCNGDSLTSCYLNHKNPRLVCVPTSLGMFPFWKTPLLQVYIDVFCLIVYANSMSKVWDPSWPQFVCFFNCQFDMALSVLHSPTFSIYYDDKRERFIEKVTRVAVCLIYKSLQRVKRCTTETSYLKASLVKKDDVFVNVMLSFQNSGSDGFSYALLWSYPLLEMFKLGEPSEDNEFSAFMCSSTFCGALFINIALLEP